MPATWREKVARNWMNTRLGHEAMVMDGLQQKAAMVNRLVRKTQDGSLGTKTDEPEDEADGMGVSIGNEIHYHYATPSPSTTLPRVETGGDGSDPVSAGSRAVPLSNLAKAALVAGALAGSGGLGATAMHVLTREPAPVVESVDTDTTYELRLTQPGGVE